MTTIAAANLQQRFLSRFLGYEVVGPTGDTLGTLWNFALDLKTGELAYAILRSEDRLFAFLWDEFHLRDNKILELQMSAEILRELPGFDPANCPDWRGHRVRLLDENALV